MPANALSYDTGDTAQLGFTLTTGDPPIQVEADTIGLTVTAPDGTTTTAPPGDIVHTAGSGTYAYRIIVGQVGTWWYRWTATGTHDDQPFVVTESDQITVRAGGARLLSLSEVKAALNYPPASTSDDDELRSYIDQAADVVEYYCGAVLTRTVTETLRSGRRDRVLGSYPVLTLVSVNGNTDIAGYELRAGGVIDGLDRTTDATVSYRVGREPVPEAIRGAARELIEHWWQGSQQRSMAAPGQYLGSDGYDSTNIIPGVGYGVPYRVLDRLRPFMIRRVG